MLNPYLNQPWPLRIIKVNQLLTEGQVFNHGDDLYATSNTFYKLFFSIWDFEKAFDACQSLAMLEVEKVIERY